MFVASGCLVSVTSARHSADEVAVQPPAWHARQHAAVLRSEAHLVCELSHAGGCIRIRHWLEICVLQGMQQRLLRVGLEAAKREFRGRAASSSSACIGRVFACSDLV
jgi:hypothetical protein